MSFETLGQIARYFVLLPVGYLAIWIISIYVCHKGDKRPQKKKGKK